MTGFTRWLAGRAAAVAGGPATWFGAGLTAAAGCFLGYTLLLAPPAVARVELPPRPGQVGALPGVWTSPGPAAAGTPSTPAATPPPRPSPSSSAWTSPARAAPTPRATPLSVCQPLAEDARVNLNTASVADLQALPGIGPAAAQHIVDARQQAPLTTVDQLHELHIVSALTLARIRDLVVLE